MTEREILRAAFAALLRGDTAERDRLIRPLLAHRVAEQHAAANAYRTSARPIQLVEQSDGTFAPAKSHQN